MATSNDGVPSDASSASSNPFAALISQNIVTLPSFKFESGAVLRDVPVAYKTWGRLNERADNCLVICHALTGSADVEDWWGPLLGPNRAFDPTRFFIFCANVIGSPYGTISSVTINPETGRPYGPEMPGSSPKDDVRLHYTVLQSLGVKSVAAVVGGSMGGMTVLEWPLCSPSGFVRSIIPIATSARHSAWCISWGEAQRQSIYSDPDYKDGYYYELDEPSSTSHQPVVDLTRQPNRGLAAARMAALLTYRSRDSFESRFGRRAGINKNSKVPRGGVRIMGGKETTDPSMPSESDLALETPGSPRDRAWREHNDGHRSSSGLPSSRRGSDPNIHSHQSTDGSSIHTSADPVASGSSSGIQVYESSNVAEGLRAAPKPGAAGAGDGKALVTGGEKPTKIFSAQSYLRYQGDKFTSRFDANCYIHITRKLDTHDLAIPSNDSSLSSLSSNLPLIPIDDEVDPASGSDPTEEDEGVYLSRALALEPPALVIGIESDGLFTTSEQKEIAAHIPDAELVLIPSPDGHDGFLLEFEAINGWVEGWLKRKMPEFYETRIIEIDQYEKEKGQEDEQGWGVKKESVFGEAEADVTRW